MSIAERMTNLPRSTAQPGDTMNPGGSEQVAFDEPRGLVWRRIELEDEILSVLAASPELGERIEMAFRRKEHELMQVFMRLSVLDAMELQRRLSLGLADDPIAMQFMRLVADRRARLTSFLAGARRREAMRRVR
jgi:hypothetical protein